MSVHIARQGNRRENETTEKERKNTSKTERERLIDPNINPTYKVSCVYSNTRNTQSPKHNQIITTIIIIKKNYIVEVYIKCWCSVRCTFSQQLVSNGERSPRQHNKIKHKCCSLSGQNQIEINTDNTYIQRTK